MGNLMNLRIVFIFINIIQIHNQYKNQFKVFLGFAKFHWGTFDEEGCPSTLLTQTPREKYKCARRDTSQNRYCLGDSPWRVLLRHPDLFALQEKSQLNSCVVFFSPNSCVAEWQFFAKVPWTGNRYTVPWNRKLSWLLQTRKNHP